METNTYELAAAKLGNLDNKSVEGIMQSSVTQVAIDLGKQEKILLKTQKMGSEIQEQMAQLNKELSEYQSATQKAVESSKSILARVFKNKVEDPKTNINLNNVNNNMQRFLLDKKHGVEMNINYVNSKSSELRTAIENCDVQLQMIALREEEVMDSSEYLELDATSQSIIATEFKDAKSLILESKTQNQQHLSYLTNFQLVILNNKKELAAVTYLVPNLISVLMTATQVQAAAETSESLQAMRKLTLDMTNETGHYINKVVEGQKINKIEHEKHLNDSINKSIDNQETFEGLWIEFTDPNSAFNRELAEIRGQREPLLLQLANKSQTQIANNKVLSDNL